jgi:hypothetical protein
VKASSKLSDRIAVGALGSETESNGFIIGKTK